MKIDHLFAELRRRNVFRAAAFYAAGAWLLVQIATQVFPFFRIAEWLVRWIIIASIIGFPFWILFAWFYQWTPEGLQREQPAVPVQPEARQFRRRADRWIMAMLACAVVLLLTDKFVLRDADQNAAIPEKSIAVLPLVNTSGDASNEYFSDGLSEELIAVLAKIPELKVIGRSSSFFFKGKGGDPAEIGQKLGVAHLIEGSVRKQGDRVRIVAELISAADSQSLWTETYDRELKDVFAVQAEIARAVAEQMKVKLLGGTVPSVAAGTSENPAAHNAVLQSDFCFQQQTAESVRRAIGFLEEAVRLDPSYALAYAKLAEAWRQYAASFSTEATDDTARAYNEARRAANRAVSLAPDLVETRMAVGLAAMNPDLDFRAAENEFRRVLQSAPSDAGAKSALSLALLAQGRLREAERSGLEAISLDPLLTSRWYNVGRVAVGLGHYKEAEERFRKGLELQPRAARFHCYLVILDILQNRPAQAAGNAQLESEGFWRDYAINLVQQWQSDRSAAADAMLKDFIAKYSNTGAFQIAVLYALRKEPDEMFKWLETAYATRDSGLTQLAVTPFFLPFVHDPRFASLCHKLNVELPRDTGKQ